MKAVPLFFLLIVLSVTGMVSRPAHAFFFKKACFSCVKPRPCFGGACAVKVRVREFPSVCRGCVKQAFHPASYHPGYSYYSYGPTLLDMIRAKWAAYSNAVRAAYAAPAPAAAARAHPTIVRVFKDDGKWYEELSDGSRTWLPADEYAGNGWWFENTGHKHAFCDEAWDWYKDWRRSPRRVNIPPKKVRVFLNDEWGWCGFAKAPDWTEPVPHNAVTRVNVRVRSTHSARPPIRFSGG